MAADTGCDGCASEVGGAIAVNGVEVGYAPGVEDAGGVQDEVDALHGVCGDGWITNVPSPEMFTKCLDKIREKSNELDRDVSGMPRALYISVNLNDEEEALSEGDGFMRAYYGIPYEVVSKQLLCVFGPAQQCSDAIMRYKEAGANYFIVRFASPNQMEQLAKITESVAPHD